MAGGKPATRVLWAPRIFLLIGSHPHCERARLSRNQGFRIRGSVVGPCARDLCCVVIAIQ